MSQKIYLITGATGTTGASLVEKLAAADSHNEIRAATRNPSSPKSQRLRQFGDNIRLVSSNWDDVSSIQDAFRGVTHLYALPPFVPPEMVQWHRNLMEIAAKYADLEFVVKHSVIGARLPQPDDTPSGIPLIHGYGEQAIKESGVPYASLRPTIFAQHFTTNQAIIAPGDNQFFLPIGSAKVAFLDARDIGTIAVHLLTLDDPSKHNGAAYTLTGPEGITIEQMQAVLSQKTGRQIRWVDVSDEMFMDRLKKAGRSTAVINVYKEAREGWFAEPTADFENVVGVPATSYEQFVADHVDYFK
ncbi:MAG: NmrA family NAD(P)-binding protein [Chloroflexota bacterium]